MKYTKHKIIILLLLLGASVFVKATKQKAVSMNITFPVKFHYFGKVWAEKGNFGKEFIFINNTDKPITITKVITGCSCTYPRYRHRPINPGEESELFLGFRINALKGYFSKIVKVYTDAEPNVPIKIQLTGQIYRNSKLEGNFIKQGFLVSYKDKVTFPKTINKEDTISRDFVLINLSPKDTIEVSLSVSRKFRLKHNPDLRILPGGNRLIEITTKKLKRTDEIKYFTIEEKRKQETKTIKIPIVFE